MRFCEKTSNLEQSLYGLVLFPYDYLWNEKLEINALILRGVLAIIYNIFQIWFGTDDSQLRIYL